MSWSRGARIAGLAAALVCAIVGAAAAQAWPSRPITILVGFPPGGGTDAPTRQIADKMRVALGVPVIVDNRPGANQMIAIRLAQAAAPDGYTLMVGTGTSLGQNPALNPTLGYDPEKDFTPIARFGESTAVIAVGPTVPVKTLKELVAYVRARPGKVTYGTAGIGSANHLMLELFSHHLGLDMVHVPYRGDAAATLDLSEGRVDVGMPTYNTVQPFLGKLTLLANTSTTRLSFGPDVATLTDAGLPELGVMHPYTWYGLVGPANLPPDIVDKLSRAVNEATRSPEIITFFRERLLTEPVTENPEQFRAFIAAQVAKWKPFAGKIKIETN